LRETGHDELVLAVTLSCWAAMRPEGRMVRLRWVGVPKPVGW
jgi:hypothetical protein